MHVAAPYGLALGLLEIRSIARGIVVCDALVKKAEVRLLRTETITPGKYLIVIDGDEASVEEALAAGVEVAKDSLLDRLFLTQPHPELWAGLSGAVPRPVLDSVGVVETETIASTLAAADAALKAAGVTLVQMHLARAIGGKGWFAITGTLDAVQAAVDAAVASVGNALLTGVEIVAAPHSDLDGTAL